MAHYGDFLSDEVEALMSEKDEVVWGRAGLFCLNEEFFAGALLNDIENNEKVSPTSQFG